MGGTLRRPRLRRLRMAQIKIEPQQGGGLAPEFLRSQSPCGLTRRIATVLQSDVQEIRRAWPAERF